MSVNLQAKVTDSLGAIATKDFSIFVPSPGGGDYVPPVSIDPTGVVESSLAFLAWLQTVPDGSTIQLPDIATYWWENTIPIHDRNDLTIQGNGATAEARTNGASSPGYPGQKRHLWPRTRCQFEIHDCNGILIENLIARGANLNSGLDGYVAAIEGQHAFEVKGGTDVTLKTCEGYDIYGDMVWIGGGANGVRVLGGHFEGTGRQGWAIVGARNVLIEGAYLGEIARTMIDLEPSVDNAVVDQVAIRDCEFGKCNHLWIHSGGKGNVGNVLAEDNLIHEVGMKVLVHSSPNALNQRRGPHAFLNNACDAVTGGPQAFFRFRQTDGVTVVGNSGQHQERDVPGVDTCGCTDVEVHDNAFTGVTMEHEDSAVCT